MRVTIIPGENSVEIDGRRVFVDLSQLLASTMQVQWFGQNGIHQAPPVDGEEGPVERLTSLAPYQPYIDAALTEIARLDTPPPVTIEALRHSSSALVDAEAGKARSRFITVTAGQEMTYLEKVTQARAFGADEDPDVEDYPLLAGEVGITGDSLTEVAGVILGRYAQWQQIGAVIEQRRLAAKRDIALAETPEAIAAILAALAWPMPD
ncbi:hypothetical protein [Dongia sp.]|uniref:hypothetical protein n=1 Tax=Dongia sp. TaxID=1977262 RepID=UPI0035B0995F